DDPPSTCTTMSTPPSSVATASATAPHPCRVARSASMIIAPGMSSGRRRAAVNTRAPCSTNSSTTARPRPLVPPVTSTRLPCNSRSIISTPPPSKVARPPSAARTGYQNELPWLRQERRYTAMAGPARAGYFADWPYTNQERTKRLVRLTLPRAALGQFTHRRRLPHPHHCRRRRHLLTHRGASSFRAR